MKKLIIICLLLSVVSLGALVLIKTDVIFPSIINEEIFEEDTSTDSYIPIIRGEEYFNKELQESFSNDIENILEEDIEDYGIYIKMLNGDFEYRLNSKKKFFPASIFKVPIAKLILQDIDNGIYDYETELTLKSEYQLYDSGPLQDEQEGAKYHLDLLLKYMITYSDNTSWYMIMNKLSEGDVSIEERFGSDLDVYNTTRVPFETTAEDIGQIMEDIYNCKDLTEESCSFLKEIMNSDQMDELHNDRLVATLPEEAEIYHKIGNWEGIYQDAGFVIGPYNDYVIVVLNKDTTFREAREKIGQISRIVWNLGNE